MRIKNRGWANFRITTMAGQTCVVDGGYTEHEVTLKINPNIYCPNIKHLGHTMNSLLKKLLGKRTLNEWLAQDENTALKQAHTLAEQANTYITHKYFDQTKRSLKPTTKRSSNRTYKKWTTCYTNITAEDIIDYWHDNKGDTK